LVALEATEEDRKATAVLETPTMITTVVTATTVGTMMEATVVAMVVKDTQVAPLMVACPVALTTTLPQLTPQLSMPVTLETRVCSAPPSACFLATRHSKETLMKTKP
jgi:hypothetical protein